MDSRRWTAGDVGCRELHIGEIASTGMDEDDEEIEDQRRAANPHWEGNY